MGYRNRMLSSLDDAIRYATEARDAMAKNPPDCDEAVRASLDTLASVSGALSEWYDSTNPVPVTIIDSRPDAVRLLLEGLALHADAAHGGRIEVADWIARARTWLKETR